MDSKREGDNSYSNLTEVQKYNKFGYMLEVEKYVIISVSAVSPREETQCCGSGQEEEGAVCAQPARRECSCQVFPSNEEVRRILYFKICNCDD